MIFLAIPWSYSLGTYSLNSRLQTSDCYWYTVCLFLCFLISVFFEYLIANKSSVDDNPAQYTKYIRILITFSLEEADKKTTKQKLKLTLYYFFIVFFGNLLMFILMTYNFGIILALLFGNALGFFLFGFDNKSRSQVAHNLH